MICLILIISIHTTAQKKNDTIYNYYDGDHKLIRFDKKDSIEVKLPLYREKYYFNNFTKQYENIRCRIEEVEILKKYNIII